ncbi:hypothetical protein CISG_02899 [Coccidioides immitis RMSCC 3703]|uniref:Uncharacterized protein n=2 Tax=Coccidioides immitis TaxID=5501 RepID=A0A0J8QIH2_COCIT|nr:hypothetical protein CIRG_08174 [Coccidioides immitis RMSCC 2394]KMU72250.1 hypothetical protein CISG_02899 [Coccidioides immitis RMSCC 3703]
MRKKECLLFLPLGTVVLGEGTAEKGLAERRMQRQEMRELRHYEEHKLLLKQGKKRRGQSARARTGLAQGYQPMAWARCLRGAAAATPLAIKDSSGDPPCLGSLGAFPLTDNSRPRLHLHGDARWPYSVERQRLRDLAECLPRTGLIQITPDPGPVPVDRRHRQWHGTVQVHGLRS